MCHASFAFSIGLPSSLLVWGVTITLTIQDAASWHSWILLWRWNPQMLQHMKLTYRNPTVYEKHNVLFSYACTQISSHSDEDDEIRLLKTNNMSLFSWYTGADNLPWAAEQYSARLTINCYPPNGQGSCPIPCIHNMCTWSQSSTVALQLSSDVKRFNTCNMIIKTTRIDLLGNFVPQFCLTCQQHQVGMFTNQTYKSCNDISYM